MKAVLPSPQVSTTAPMRPRDQCRRRPIRSNSSQEPMNTSQGDSARYQTSRRKSSFGNSSMTSAGSARSMIQVLITAGASRGRRPERANSTPSPRQMSSSRNEDMRIVYGSRRAFYAPARPASPDRDQGLNAERLTNRFISAGGRIRSCADSARCSGPGAASGPASLPVSRVRYAPHTPRPISDRCRARR